MPLTGAEKTQLLQGVQGTSALLQTVVLSAKVLAPVVVGGVPTTVSVGALGPLSLPALAFLPGIIGLTSLLGRPRFPTGGTEEQIFGQIRDIDRTGRRGRISTDPFTGRPVISAFDQDPHLFSLLERRAQTRAVAPLLPEFNRQLLADRDALIASLEETRLERGFARSLSDLPERGGVFRPTAESPLEFVAGDFLS